MFPYAEHKSIVGHPEILKVPTIEVSTEGEYIPSVDEIVEQVQSLHVPAEDDASDIA